jgi:hypothetical protein
MRRAHLPNARAYLVDDRPFCLDSLSAGSSDLSAAHKTVDAVTATAMAIQVEVGDASSKDLNKIARFNFFGVLTHTKNKIFNPLTSYIVADKNAEYVLRVGETAECNVVHIAIPWTMLTLVSQLEVV